MTPKKQMNQPRQQAKSSRKPPVERADIVESMQSKGSNASHESRPPVPKKAGHRPPSR